MSHHPAYVSLCTSRVRIRANKGQGTSTENRRGGTQIYNQMQIRVADDFIFAWIFPILIGSPGRDRRLDLGSSSSDSTLTDVANLHLLRAPNTGEDSPQLRAPSSSPVLCRVIGCQSSDPTLFPVPIAILGRLLPFIEQTIVGKESLALASSSSCSPSSYQKSPSVLASC